MRFVKLTNHLNYTNDTVHVYVNLQHVVSIHDCGSHTRIVTLKTNDSSSSTDFIDVKETPEEILIKSPVIGG